jgi:hypothetical protein
LYAGNTTFEIDELIEKSSVITFRDLENQKEMDSNDNNLQDHPESN